MGVLIAPTRTNLMKAKSSLELSSKGFELLDRKRNILIKEMMQLVEKARNIQDKIYRIIAEAYNSLQVANITLGIKEVEDMTWSIPCDEDYEVLMKSVMGVDIPVVRYKRQVMTPAYGFYTSNAALDNARNNFNEVRYGIYELAEVEDSIFKLAREIEKINRRTNALQYIQIPKFREQIKYITDVLEEKGREDFFRLKRVKKKLGSK